MPKPNRRLSGETVSTPIRHYTSSKAWDEFYNLIGRIVVTINSAHWCVFEMMGILLNTSREDTTPIYYSLKADAAQRDLTLAIMSDRLSEPSEADLAKRISITINDLGKASGLRNAFIHTHWSMEWGNDKLVVTDGKPHPKLRMDDLFGQGSELLATLDEIIDRLLAHCDELEETPSVQKLRTRMSSNRT